MAGLSGFVGAMFPNEDKTPNMLQRFDTSMQDPGEQLQQLQVQQAMQKMKQEQAVQTALQKWQQGGGGDIKELKIDLATADPSYLLKMIEDADKGKKSVTIGGNIIQYDENNPSATPQVLYSQPTAADKEAALKEDANKELKKATVVAGNELLPVMNTALQQIDKPRTEGVVGAISRQIPGTSAYDMDANLATIRARVSLDELAKLKANSPNGSSGLGSQSNQEQKNLQDSIANIQSGQSDEQLKNNLLKVKKHYVNYLESLGYEVPADLKSGKTTVADEVRPVTAVNPKTGETLTLINGKWQ